MKKALMNRLALVLSLSFAILAVFAIYPSGVQTEGERNDQSIHELALAIHAQRKISGFWPGFEEEKGEVQYLMNNKTLFDSESYKVFFSLLDKKEQIKFDRLKVNAKNSIICFNNDRDEWIDFEDLRIRCKCAHVIKFLTYYRVKILW